MNAEEREPSSRLPSGSQLASARVLIVDDEQGICRELEKIFVSSGFEAFSIQAPEELEEALLRRPDIVLLDIWMPGRDGMELLQEIQSLESPPSVIMMSGHATISTAVKATQMGAFDFLEKPLDVETMFLKVRAALTKRQQTAEPGRGIDVAHRIIHGDIGIDGGSTQPHPVLEFMAGERVSCSAHPGIFGKQVWAGRPVTQRTIGHSTILYGQGLHSGIKSGISLEPLPPNSGVNFIGVSGRSVVPAHVDFVESTGFATTLKGGGSSVQTIEHLLSALHAFQISNLLIKCNEEVPILDGSAIQFCKALQEVGVVEQEGEWYSLCPPRRVVFDNGKEQISIEPAERLMIEYHLSYPAPLGKQDFVYNQHSPEDYIREIAQARTFGFVQDIGYLQAKGLAQGGRMDNFVLYGKDGAINQSLRFPDEAVRHKILDIMGDLYLLGRPLQAKITATMTGHSDNIELLRLLQREMSAA